MKKMLIIVLSFLFLFLIGCVVTDPDELMISLAPGVDTIDIHSEYSDSKAIATYGFLTLKTEVIANDLNCHALGEYTIVYQANWKDRTATVTRKIQVVDETAPVINLRAGIDTVVVGSTWTDASADVSDNSLETLSLQTQGTVDTLTAGDYEITYTSVDSSGNQATITRYVHVVEPRSKNSLTTKKAAFDHSIAAF